MYNYLDYATNKMKNGLSLFFLSFLVISLTQSYAATFTDTFTGTNDGWNGGTVVSNTYRIYRDTTASKTYDFGVPNANKPISINLTVTCEGGWEASGTGMDVLNVRANTLLSQGYYTNGTYDFATINTVLDSNGRVTLSVNPNTTADGENVRIDNVTITTTSPAFTISNNSITEGNSGSANLNFNITLSATTTASVDYATSNGTALSGSDYTATNGTLSFTTAGTKTISIPILGDTLFEPNETFTITLTNPINAEIDTATAIGTIINDDAQPSFSIADVTINEGSSGIYTKNVPVTLSNPDGSTVTINYATANGTATTAGNDYNATSGTLTFSGTTTVQNIPVKINGDTTEENSETFTITLSNASSGTTISKGTGTITLVNDDGGDAHVGERNFLIRNPSTTQNIKGNLRVIGNTVLCVKDANNQCYDYTGDSSNSELDLKYIDVDGINRTFNNSSQAILSIPTTATIKWAAIYTQGYMNDITNTTIIDTTLKEAVYVTVPTIGTLVSSPEVVDIYANGGDGYTYSTYASLPGLIGATGAQVNGLVTGANIKAYQGGDGSGLGNFGAWTLVVVYEDASETLKNISVFDGYKRVANADGFRTVNITVDGFLTPTSGDVHSTVSIFTGEGDKNIAGDKLYVDGIAINQTNAFFSATSGFTPVPNYTNKQGIDIQNHEIGIDRSSTHLQIIGNSRKSSTITLTSTQDTYFPSMVAFTTELYEPRVCYVEAYYDTNGSILSNPTINDTVVVKTWIANMKKDATDGNLETAEKVEITVELDDINLEYVTNTTAIQNIGETVYSSKTDTQGDDTADFFSDKNTSVWRIGTGANSIDGGDLLPNADNNATNKVYVSFNTKLLTSGNISLSNLYKVSYENSNMGLRIGDESPVNIGICKDFNTTIVVNAPLGVFNVVNSNYSGNTGSTISTDSKHADNALYTQIASQAFNVKMLALNTDFTTLKAYTGDANLSLIATPNYLQGDSDAQKQAKCDAAASLTALQTISFSNQSVKDLTLTYPSAYRDIAFKITYNDNGTTKHVCSRDSFSIRPDTFTLVPSSSPLIGGRNYSLTISAMSGGAITPNYDQSITNTADKNASMDLSVPTGCAITPSNTPLASFAFTNGSIVYNPFIYSNIGDVNVTIIDNDWTKIDQTRFNTKGYDDCIPDSSTNIPVGGKIGCLISKVQPFVFSPKAFNNTLDVTNFNNALFTYISESDTMSANAILTATAVLDDNTTATNYTAGCFAKDVTYNISMLNNPTTWLNGTGTADAIHRIRYFEDGTSSNLDSNTTGAATFSSTEGNFTSGVAPLTMRFNFTRAVNVLDEPFQVLKNDFNISIQDTNGTFGSDFNRTLNPDQNATFYYGRVHIPDTTISGNFANDVRVYYEVYSRTRTAAQRTQFDINGSESVDSINWYNNTLHTPAHMQLVDANYTSVSGTNSSGAQALSIDLTAPKAPHKDKIQIHGPTWLIQNPTNAGATTNDFLIEFTTGATTWAGQGRLGHTVDDTNTSVSKKSNKRIEW